MKYKYNPQFIYANTPALSLKHSEPDYEYLALSLKILNGIIDQYGSIENYFNIDGGRKLNIMETKTYFNKYIQSLKMSKYMEITFS